MELRICSCDADIRALAALATKSGMSILQPSFQRNRLIIWLRNSRAIRH